VKFQPAARQQAAGFLLPVTRLAGKRIGMLMRYERVLN
jgi:hypothetical protein